MKNLTWIAIVLCGALAAGTRGDEPHGVKMRNLALNAKVVASSAMDRGPAKFAVDGKLSTRWLSNAAVLSWLEIDLGMRLRVGGVHIYSGNQDRAPINNFIIRYLADGRGPAMTPVRGNVLYEDKALEYGGVMFQPVGGGRLARGRIESDGTFVLSTYAQGDGVQIGLCRVRITAFEAQRPPSSAAKFEGETPLGKSAIPAKYQGFGSSGIEIEVTADMPQPVIINLE